MANPKIVIDVQTHLDDIDKQIKFSDRKNLNNKVSNNKVRTGNEVNYLEELKQKRLLKSIENNTNMSKSILNIENNDFNLKNKIEEIESKYKRNKELLII